jgi:hypothetical protein
MSAFSVNSFHSAKQDHSIGSGLPFGGGKDRIGGNARNVQEIEVNGLSRGLK